MNKKQFLKELLGLLEEGGELLKDMNWGIDYRATVKAELTKIKLSENFGVKFPKYNSGSDYIETKINCIAMSYYPEQNTNKTISWSDDGRQPENEWLMVVSFPCGAYTFHSEYPTETFNQFFVELKSYQPKYCDSANKTLYFSEENSKLIWDAFPEIFKRYTDMVDEELKRKRKARLEAELKKLS